MSSLIKLFHEGADPSQLRSLLKDKDSTVVAAGAYILAELGQKGRPFITEAICLLAHGNPSVRFRALDCLLASTEPGDRAAIRSCLLLLADADENVRWKAREFIARKNLAALEAALRALREMPLREGGDEKALVPRTSHVGADLEVAARSPNPIIRAQALTIAALIFRCEREEAVEAATGSGEIAELAEQCLRVRRR